MTETLDCVLGVAGKMGMHSVEHEARSAGAWAPTSEMRYTRHRGSSEDEGI